MDLGILDKSCYIECEDIVERLWNEGGEGLKVHGLRQSGLSEHVKYLRELYDDGCETTF